MPAEMGMVVLASAAPFHQQHHHESLLSSCTAEQHPIIPLLAAAPCLVDDDNAARAKPGGIHLWQPTQPQPPHHHHYLPPAHSVNPNPNSNPTFSNYLRKPVPTMLDASGILSGCVAAAGSGVPTCQDCGNQAKKDCSHRRCRTCCKSRGFDCSTHVKSTWVPASRRRERQLNATSAGVAGSSASASAPKKPRLVASQPETASHTPNATPPRSFDTTSSHQDASLRERLPGQVRAPAVFKCVRLASIDNGEGEYAYHAVVKIGGRVFRGFLYGHGLDDSSDHLNDAKDAVPNISRLHLGNRNGGASSSSPMLPSDVFGGGGGMIGGTNYGNQIS